MANEACLRGEKNASLFFARGIIYICVNDILSFLFTIISHLYHHFEPRKCDLKEKCCNALRDC